MGRDWQVVERPINGPWRQRPGRRPPSHATAVGHRPRVLDIAANADGLQHAHNNTHDHAGHENVADI
eukprot:9515503-Lingulodinium_polyedra.AAC.1